MELWIALVAGVIVGWLIEWIVDWLYWRRNLGEFYATEARLREDLELAQARTGDAQATLARLRGDLQEMRLRFDGLAKAESDARQQIQVLQGLVQTQADVEAGLRAELADAQAAAQQAAAQQAAAQQAAAQQAAALAVAATASPDGAVRTSEAVPRIHRRDDLERIGGIGRVYEQKLFDAGIETYAQLAASSEEQLAEIIVPQSWQQVDFAAWIAQARQFAEVVLEEMLPYRLEAIRGIGPVYVKRLNAAGIRTFADLAAADEEVLRDIIRPASWQNVDFIGWRAEAKQFAALVAGDRPPLPLEQIKGIGPVFAAKLEMAGVHSFDDLSRLSEAQVREIIGGRAWGAVNYAGWTAEARELAAGAAAADPAAEVG